MRVFVNKVLFGDFPDRTLAEVALSKVELGDGEGTYVCSANAARQLCAAHIEHNYPTYKQLNLLRSGTKAEKDKMDTFINACRDWSNGENPDPAALEAIQP